MKYFSLCLILTSAFLLGSCSGNDKPNNLITIDIQEALKKNGSVKLSELVSDVEFVEFDTVHPEAYFDQARSISVGKNYILIAREFQNQVILFDRNGMFIRLIGRVGKGPGEYVNCFVVGMDPNEKFVFVADYVQKRLIKYAISGEYIKSILYTDVIPRSLIDDIVFIDDNHFGLQVRRNGEPTNNYCSLPVFDLDLNLTHQYLKRANDEDLKLVYDHYKTVFKLDDKVLFCESYFDTVYYLYPDGREEAAYRFDLGKNGFSRNYLSDYNTFKNSSSLDFDFVSSVSETQDYLFISGFASGAFTLAHRKKSGETFSLPAAENCGLFKEPYHTLENDLFGVNPIFIRYSHPDLKIYPVWMWTCRHDLNKTDVINCIRAQQVLLPEKRDEFVKIAERSDAGTLLLVLLKMK